MVAMKMKLKPVKLSPKRAIAASTHAVVPLKERRLTFGNKWDYAPAPEDSKNYVIAPQHELFINGKFVAPKSGKYFESVNPATEQTLTTIAAANAEDVDSAVKAARRAYEKVWSKMPGRERGKYLYRIARIIQEKARELAVLETMDGGKTIKESRDVDLPLVAAHFFYYAGWADKLKFAFTGSTEVGKAIARIVAQASSPVRSEETHGRDARAPKKLALELGGKAANILFEDAPIDQAIEGVIAGIYFNQGHVCCAGSRLFVQEGVYPTVIRKLRDRIQTLRVGNPLDKNTDIGAINSRPQLEKIRALVQIGMSEGAGLEQSRCALPARGYWYPPTFLTGVTMASRVAQEEIFGPVLSVMTFRTPEEAFERANNTPYGLSAGVWTDKGSKIFKMVNQLRAGVVWANTYNKFDPSSPFGGYKESGFGREGGRHGLLPYLTLS